MSNVTPEQLQSYQWLLRGLGAYLDDESSCHITVLEVPDGFLVRLHRVLHNLQPEVKLFTRDALGQVLEDLYARRRTTDRQTRGGIWATFPNGHSDFFRALGWELDRARARGILIDELEDSVVVTYDCPGEENSRTYEKRMTVLGLNEIEGLLNRAFERRKKSPKTA
jgi:hypothetical protein